MEISGQQISLLKSLFKGRQDAFAKRWEKGNKNGYAPACYYDPYHYRNYQLKGGTFKDYPDKKLLVLTDEQIVKHITGEQFIGIYPLLQDNISWFIAADFDKGDWISAAKKFMNYCLDKNIPAYLERSRSGSGGHVWIFFETPLPAFKTRKVITNFLISTGAISTFDKSGSFDRLFPNQDQLSSETALGNLIALPLNGTAMQQGNTCFLDPETLLPYKDQWKFMTEIKRAPKQIFENLFTALTSNKVIQTVNGKLTITLGNDIQLNKDAISLILHSYIREELNFHNVEYIIKKNSGRSTFGNEKYLRFIREDGNTVHLPKGFIGKLIRFCRDRQLEYTFCDDRTVKKKVFFSFQATLRPYQEASMSAISKKDMGVIVAPPGSGKTILALKIISDRQQPALIVVHRKQLEVQWIERIEAFLGVAKKDIGKISQGKNKIGKQVTVATIQSLAKTADPEIYNSFGLIVVDECHHIPAATFSDTLGKFNSRYLYGLTATPFRKYSDGKLIFIHLGELITEINSNALPGAHHPRIIIRSTELDVPFNAKIDRFETLSNILIHDSSRNRLILDDISNELKQGRKCVILTERKEHIETLEQYLKQSFETITLSGTDSENARKSKWTILKTGNYQVLITTGQFFGEGSDLQNAECLFLVYPFSFEGKLIQYMGRVQRSELCPTIYDYRDAKIDYLNRMFLKRNVYYRKLQNQRTLFDFPVEEQHHAETPVFKDAIFEKQVKIKIQELEFLYGSIRFQYSLPEYPDILSSDIENLHIRPEFEVLKPYFEKFLQSKSVNIHITLIVNAQKKLVALSANSSDLNKLNSEIVESARFRFIEKQLFGKRHPMQDKAIENTAISQGKGLYESGEQLLTDLLARGNYKHQKQLRFLAERHEGKILKIRFILLPFAFVFLLAGNECYYLILETLDTEEATYLWHLPKDIQELKPEIRRIDQQLNQIRNEGRQKFLESAPINFSKLMHDYSEDHRGFITWRDQLEQRLF